MMTITEALAETNLVKKKITEKENFTFKMVAIPDHEEDPFKSKGGAKACIEKEFQAIKDLRVRLVGIRTAISRANIQHTITINGVENSIFNWLTWKREIYQPLADYNRKLMSEVTNKSGAQKSRPQVYNDKEGNAQLLKWNYSVDISDLQKNIEDTDETYAKLDGQLSLKNATIMLEI